MVVMIFSPRCGSLEARARSVAQAWWRCRVLLSGQASIALMAAQWSLITGASRRGVALAVRCDAGVSAGSAGAAGPTAGARGRGARPGHGGGLDGHRDLDRGRRSGGTTHHDRYGLDVLHGGCNLPGLDHRLLRGLHGLARLDCLAPAAGDEDPCSSKDRRENAHRRGGPAACCAAKNIDILRQRCAPYC